MHGTLGIGTGDTLDAKASVRLSLRLKAARRMRGLTLKGLAGAARCSESLLSKIENGKAIPSLPMLHRLAEALDISMGWIFDAERDSAISILRADRTDPARAAAGALPVPLQDLPSQAQDSAVTCAVYHIKTGVQSNTWRKNQGHEVGYIISGQLDLYVGGRNHRLSEGDCFAFCSDQPHSFVNLGTSSSKIFWARTPPHG